jgi:hypothetical protein
MAAGVPDWLFPLEIERHGNKVGAGITAVVSHRGFQSESETLLTRSTTVGWRRAPLALEDFSHSDLSGEVNEDDGMVIESLDAWYEW